METSKMTAKDFRLDWHEPTESSVVVPMTVIAQMVNGLVFDPLTDCWSFTAPSAKRDHPALSFGGCHTIALDALTLIFELDAPAPAGAHVLRSCNNPRCLAPYHLRWSTVENEDAGTSGDTAERTLHARTGAAVRYCEGLHS